jgi:ubiquinone biosynthesis protein
VAAASVAQVHRAVLIDGSEVAVKVLRPDVRQKAERDGRILRFWAGILELVSIRARHAQLREHLAHFVSGIIEQTDLRIEARNYEQFRKNFRRVKKVHFPRVYAELSAERVMTMEFVRGEKIDAIPREQLPPEFPRHLREVFLQMCFDDGFLHADLHPGNFVVSPDGTLTIFDVGLVKELKDELLEHFIDFNRCIVMGEVEDFMRHMRTYHRYVEGAVDWVELEKDVERFAATFRGMSTRELEFGQLIEEIFAVGRKHGLHPVPEMTLMMVGLVTAEGIGKQLEPDINSFQEVANYLVPILARRNMLSGKVMQAAAAVSERVLRDADAANTKNAGADSATA